MLRQKVGRVVVADDCRTSPRTLFFCNLVLLLVCHIPVAPPCDGFVEIMRRNKIAVRYFLRMKNDDQISQADLPII